jgi:hypothetical protein
LLSGIPPKIVKQDREAEGLLAEVSRSEEPLFARPVGCTTCPHSGQASVPGAVAWAAASMSTVARALVTRARVHRVRLPLFRETPKMEELSLRVVDEAARADGLGAERADRVRRTPPPFHAVQ